MRYFKIGYNWWQRIDGDTVTDVWERHNGLAIITEINPDPIGPRVGQESTEEEFQSKIKSIYESINKTAAPGSN